MAVHSEGPAGTDNTFADSAIRTVSAGTHTVYMLVYRYGLGTGTVHVSDSTLSVIGIPSPDTDVVTCWHHSSGDPPFTTAEETYQVVSECSLTAPANGWV